MPAIAFYNRGLALRRRVESENESREYSIPLLVHISEGSLIGAETCCNHAARDKPRPRVVMGIMMRRGRCRGIKASAKLEEYRPRVTRIPGNSRPPFVMPDCLPTTRTRSPAKPAVVLPAIQRALSRCTSSPPSSRKISSKLQSSELRDFSSRMRDYAGPHLLRGSAMP